MLLFQGSPVPLSGPKGLHAPAGPVRMESRKLGGRGSGLRCQDGMRRLPGTSAPMTRASARSMQPSTSVSLFRHVRHLRQRQGEELIGSPSATRDRASSHQVRQRAHRQPARPHQRASGLCAGRVRRPQAARRRRHRSLPAPRRSDVPIEDTVGAMARLIEQGKVRYLGLCEAGQTQIARASRTSISACKPVLAVDQDIESK